MGKVIAVWGSPNSGKTTFSIKLARELAKNKTVMIVFTDIVSPVMPMIIKDSSNKSLGNVLSSASLSKDDILKNSSYIQNSKNIGVLGYAGKENVFNYPQYSRERAIEFIKEMRYLVDYTILDLSSNFVNDMLTTTALEFSDEVIRISSSSLKDISYYESYLPLLSSNKFSIDKHINILSNFREHDAIEELKELYNVKEQIEFMDEIREQSMCNELFNSLSSKEEEKLRVKLNNIINMIEVLEPVKKRKNSPKFMNMVRGLVRGRKEGKEYECSSQ